MDQVITINVNTLIIVLIGAAVSYGGMMATLLNLRQAVKDHMEQEQKLLQDHEDRLRKLESAGKAV